MIGWKAPSNVRNGGLNFKVGAQILINPSVQNVKKYMIDPGCPAAILSMTTEDGSVLMGKICAVGARIVVR